jgi:flavin reductase (DIM6/NTAB) family NADH-FMN oxidoreductase RutF
MSRANRNREMSLTRTRLALIWITTRNNSPSSGCPPAFVPPPGFRPPAFKFRLTPSSDTFFPQQARTGCLIVAGALHVY